MLKHLGPYIPAIGLGVTQIMGYGTLMYAYAVLLPHMADDLSLTLSTVFGVLSLGLFFGGLASPVAGMLVDRFGGRYVMTFGSIVAAIALASLSLVEGVIGLFLAILLVEGAGRFILYNVAFASVARLDNPVPAKKSISIITLFGGVASTIFWPLTLALYNGLGWQNTWVVMGVALGVVCVPIHFWALRGPQKDHDAPQSRNDTDWPELAEQDRMRGMLWMVLSFVFTGYIMGAIMSLWVVNVQDLGHSAGIAALAGAVIGPFKTVGRGFEMLVSRNMYPLFTYFLSLALMLSGFAVLLILGFTLPGVIIAAALYGMGDGIKTIAGGTLPLALFGAKGYGARLGWISFVQLGVNASAPFVFAWITQVYGGWYSFAAMTLCLLAGLFTYFFIPDPRRHSNAPA
ncbi:MULTISPECIES: MFS transporter [Pacificibacter]|uniref:MFS transporter n=1 Tax=Pacificibacter TaxID=1042323 RepID=UPI001C08927A|nr:MULTISPECIES: MFS transporter [Pacificibacter]MBU2937724.1 MFS transporter [Pacificibacter marinus]MDO6616218.1 MFS transporter [Pacificibacter sp. 1_MG-2023]